MKNKFSLFLIITIILFLLSMLCFVIMKIGCNLQGIVIVNNNGNCCYHFNTFFGLIGLILYNMLKITYDKMFNEICKSYKKKSNRRILWLLYIWISIIFWIFIFVKFNIGGMLNNIYMFKYKFLQYMYLIDILFILPLWNMFYIIFKNRTKSKRIKFK